MREGMEVGREENYCAGKGFGVLNGKALTIFLCCGGMSRDHKRRVQERAAEEGKLLREQAGVGEIT